MSKWIDCDLMAGWIGGLMNGQKDNGLIDGSMDERIVQPHKSMDFGLFCSPICSKCLEQKLVHSRCSILSS